MEESLQRQATESLGTLSQMYTFSSVHHGLSAKRCTFLGSLGSPFRIFAFESTYARKLHSKRSTIGYDTQSMRSRAPTGTDVYVHFNSFYNHVMYEQTNIYTLLDQLIT